MKLTAMPTRMLAAEVVKSINSAAFSWSVAVATPLVMSFELYTISGSAELTT